MARYDYHQKQMGEYYGQPKKKKNRKNSRLRPVLRENFYPASLFPGKNKKRKN